MKNCTKTALLIGLIPLSTMLGGCQFTGEPIIKDYEETFNYGGKVNDDAPLSTRVRQALRNSPETAILRIQVSTLSDDSVKLSGSVSNDAIRYEAERVAGQVAGVRHVVNSLFVQ